MNKCRRNAARKRRRYNRWWARVTAKAWSLDEIRAASCMLTVEQ